MKIKSTILLLVILCHVSSFAQLSLYGSASYGYYQNPLYNYQELDDQLKQTYTELNYSTAFDHSKLNFSYISGLVLFNRFEDRNYYEHNLTSKYLFEFKDDELSEENTQTVSTDSISPLLTLAVRVGGRHDKDIFKDFNNFGTSALAGYRFMISDDYYFELTNTFGFRDYSNITVLSNITDILNLQIGNKTNSSFNYGLNLSGGFKYYTESIYDTSKFEVERSFTIKYSGKGKTGAKITVPSDKEILISPFAKGTSQFVADIFMKTNWGANSFQTNFLYRYNPNTLVRYLAQYANTTFLTEDIYNDIFSYEGLEIRSALIQKIFYDIEVKLDLSIQQKLFGAPALDLVGTELADQRIDLRSCTELYISRYFNLSDNLGMGIAISSGFVRNQSNDAYNDFSSYYISLSMGFGFYTEF
ncbi:MAG: hypothetical protein IPM56_00570 [Ignavibacteriales bacterium]|nr:MAG: hypothetical protein IPM56_00570 [Ignavibacteriales bacterium]